MDALQSKGPLMILKIAPIGEPVLKQCARTIIMPDEYSFTNQLALNMFETLESQGERIGLAAPQVFQSVQCVIYRIPRKTHARYKTLCEEVPLTVMINPSWQPLTQSKVDGYEACISIPGLMGIVPRYKDISLAYETLEGERVTKTVHDFHARVIQHECDHLIGKVFVEQMIDHSTLGFEDVILKQLHVDMDEVA